MWQCGGFNDNDNKPHENDNHNKPHKNDNDNETHENDKLNKTQGVLAFNLTAIDIIQHRVDWLIG